MVSPLPPECEQLLVVGYVLGNLSPAEAMLFAELVADNPELMQQVTQMQQALELAFSPPEIAPPPELKERVLLANRQQNTPRNEVESKPVTESAAIVNTTPRSRFSWSKILLAIATWLVLALGLNNYRLWRSLQSTSIETIESNRLVYSLETAKPAETKATARLVVNPSLLQASFDANNLPVLPSGKVYALWTVVGNNSPYTTDEKGAILTEVFEVNERGEYSTTITIPQPYRTNPELIDKVAITVESKSLPQAHTGSILLVGS